MLIHSTQPWPYPASLMMGCLGIAKPGGEKISFPEAELDDARWFEFSEVSEALETGASNLTDQAPPGTSLRIPPSTAIAHQLMKAALQFFEPNLVRKGLL